MLGTIGATGYRSESFSSHRDYLRFMYGNTKGFISRNRKLPPNLYEAAFSQRLYRSQMLICKNRYYGVPDVYTSLNSFLSQEKRTVDNLKRLNALYIDIDCYNIGMTQGQALYLLEQDYFNRSLPVPTFVINSGRGLYLIWKIDEDRNALPRWRSVQQHLYNVCKEFNADPQCLDAARIFRVPFSVNGKNGASVSIMRFYDVTYTLHELINEYDVKPYDTKGTHERSKRVYGEATPRQRAYAAAIAKQKGISPPDFSNYDATFAFIAENRPTSNNDVQSQHNSFLAGRCRDIFSLLTSRKGDNCRREYGLFLYRLWQCEMTHDYEYALEQTLFLNSKLDKPFSEQYVMTRTMSAEKRVRSGRTYKYNTSRLIEVLGITDAEMDGLDYLCNKPQNAVERKRKNNRRAYLMRLEHEGKQAKSDNITTRRHTIASLLAEGMSKADICATLAISARTFDRDKAFIAAEGLLERAMDALKRSIDKTASVAKAAVDGISRVIRAAFPQSPNIQPSFNENGFAVPHLTGIFQEGDVDGVPP